MIQSYSLPSAELRLDGAVAFSERFADSYSQREDPLGESEHVFLRGNGLPERWNGVAQFSIGELGFGIGRNFLLTRDLFCRTASATARLHYVAFEGYPLSPSEFELSWAGFPEWRSGVRDLIAALPKRIAGFHRIAFDEGRVLLTLVYGDAQAMLPQLVGKMDAWFLDGFAPAKNPEIWSPMVLREVARCTKPGGSCATYSAASQLRRSLEALGFVVDLAPGYGRKREMLRAQRGVGTSPLCYDRRAMIVGGGLAGSCAALSFARRGYEVAVIERSGQLASAASGNAAGVFMPHLAAKPDLMSCFYLAGYHLLIRELQRFAAAGASLPMGLHGVLRLATSARLRNLLTALPGLGLDESVVRAVNTVEGSLLAGRTVTEPGLFFPEGGWLNPPALVANNIRSAGERATIKLLTDVKRVESHDGMWFAHGEDGTLHAAAPIVILANGFHAVELDVAQSLPLEQVRGQILHLPATSSTRKLRLPVCYDGYVTPESEGMHFVGATYSHDDGDETERAEERADLLARLHSALPEFPGDPDEVKSGEITGRVAFRTMSRDRLPLIGPLPDRERFAAAFRAGGLREIPPEIFTSEGGLTISGLYLSVGHGSRGLISCHLAGEILAAHVCEEPMPLGLEVLSSITPSRYLARELKRA